MRARSLLPPSRSAEVLAEQTRCCPAQRGRRAGCRSLCCCGGAASRGRAGWRRRPGGCRSCCSCKSCPACTPSRSAATSGRWAACTWNQAPREQGYTPGAWRGGSRPPPGCCWPCRGTAGQGRGPSSAWTLVLTLEVCATLAQEFFWQALRQREALEAESHSPDATKHE